MPPNRHRALAPEIAGKLGQVSDRELAKLSGLSPYFIKQARLAKCIEPLSRGYDLPDGLVQQLGKVPDAQLTEEYGVPGPVLFRARQNRSIPRYRVLKKPDSPEYVAFPDEALALLGKVPDVELASQYGRSLQEVKQERGIRGLDSYTKGRNLPEELVQQLGLVPDSVLVRRYSVAATTIKRARDARSIARFRPSKLPKSDHWSALNQLDSAYLPPAQSTDGKLNGVKRIWSEEEDSLLGTAADSKVAELLKIDFWCVFYRRKAMSIPPFEYAYS